MRIIKHKTNIDFIGKRKPALFISSVLNLTILVGIAIFGFNFGVDFAGGTVVELRFDHPIRADEVRTRAESAGLKDGASRASEARATTATCSGWGG
jgi:preprotein translocase subunit SecF